VIGGVPVVDAHVHVARLPTLRLDRSEWIFPGLDVDPLYDEHGAIRPAALSAYLDDEGVDVALCMSEYSPKVTGIQPIEDLMPLVEHDPHRFHPIAAINPHYHYPLPAELDRQLSLGAVAVKIHPVHGGFDPGCAPLYRVYERCAERGLPVVVHCGTSTFPGADNRYGDPALLTPIIRDFPELTLLLAHGGRGWWYDAAAFLALTNPNVWIEISGLPPRKLPAYFARHDLARLARRFVFGSDWPGAPGIGANARAVADLGLPDDTVDDILHRTAARLYGVAVQAARRSTFDRASRAY
jgi:predicted TIM-barrel fold metal-dependent hydrolase